MWMKKLGCVALVLLLLAPVGVRAAGTEIDLTVAKSKRYVYAYGTVTPPHEGRKVRVRLFQDGALIETKWDVLVPAGGTTSEYEVSFARPGSGSCEVVVRYRSRSGRTTRTSESFECFVPTFGTGEATMTSATQVHTISIEVARTPEQMGYGLMYRRHLGTEKGMAFMFESDSTASFYMRNTLIPLSIAFIDSTGVVVKILDMAPCPEDPCPLYSPGTAYRTALEVNQGSFDRWYIDEGDLIQITEN
jgi:uncharacterized membrane protein (UPF0127 family)